MLTNYIALPIFPHQTKRIACDNTEGKCDDVYYFFDTYPRPKSKESIRNMVDNRIRVVDVPWGKHRQYEISLRQAWDTFDRKLFGWEFDIPKAYEDRDNCSSMFIKICVKEGGDYEINSSFEFSEIYNESIQQNVCLFSNRKRTSVKMNEFVSYSLKVLFEDLHQLQEEGLIPLEFPRLNKLCQLRSIFEEVMDAEIMTLFINDKHMDIIRNELLLSVESSDDDIL